MSLDIAELPGGFSLSLAADFSIEVDEIQKGQAAAANFLESLKGEELTTSREALETLALVFSTGVCEGVDFPWHQVRAHHGQAAFNILKEDGAPSKLESLRCQLDPHHKFRQDSPKFSSKKLQKFRTALQRVLRQSRDLGYMSKDDLTRVISPNKEIPREGDRIVSHGEFRALLVACRVDAHAESLRDRLIFYFLYHSGLKLIELLALAIDDLHFNQKTQQVTIKTGKAKNQKSRRVSLPNEALISLEDWLEQRGNEEGALLNPVTKNHKIEVRRMTSEDVKTACDKRAKEVGVAPFTPEELRASPGTMIDLEKAERKKAKLAAEESADVAPYEDEVDYDDLGGTRQLTTVCFPVWERSVKS